MASKKVTLREKAQRCVVEYLYKATIVPNSPVRNLRGEDMERMWQYGYRTAQRDQRSAKKGPVR